MNVLMVMRACLSNKEKRYGIFEWDQALALKQLGHQVFVLALDIRAIHRKRRFGIFQTQNKDITVINISFPLYGLPNKINTYLAQYCLKRGYDRVVKQFGKPDVIHAQFFEYAFYTVCAIKEERIPFVVTEHSSKINCSKIMPRDIQMAQIAYEKANAIICVSTTLANRIWEKFYKHSVVIPNIVDVSIFQCVEQVKENECFTFVTVANLVVLKRIDLLIEAVHRIVEETVDIQLIIIGDGVEKDNLENLVECYNLQKYVTLMGKLNRKQINDIFNKADCFVLASSSETFGVAYIEALAAGLPVIATRCGGPEDFVNEENGILIDVNDVGQLYEAMKKMLRGEKKYTVDKISKEIRTMYAPITVAKQIESVYLKTIKEIGKTEEYVE